MIGTIANTFGIVAGGLFGLAFGGLLKERHQDGIGKANGVSVMFIGIAGAMEGMLRIDGASLSSGRPMLVVLCLALGALFGELMDIEGWFDRFGQWLKIKTKNAKDQNFVNGFVTSSITVCIGAMAVIGSIQDGLLGDYSVLMIKSVLDFIIIMVMTCSMGKGCIFSAIPVFAFEGAMTLLSGFLRPIMTDDAMLNLSLVGAILIFAVGVNLVFGKVIRVANMLPAIAFAVAAAFLPIEF